MLLTILATANHWVLDAFAGALVPVLGWRLNGLLLIFSKVEAICLGYIGVKKPDTRHSPHPHTPTKIREVV